MTDERIDLSSLDPTGDSANFDRAARAIALRAQPLLAARRRAFRRPMSLFSEMARWSRPVLAAAGLIIVASAGALIVKDEEADAAEVPLVIANALPVTMSRALVAGEAPAPAALLFQTAGDPR